MSANAFAAALNGPTIRAIRSNLSRVISVVSAVISSNSGIGQPIRQSRPADVPAEERTPLAPKFAHLDPARETVEFGEGVQISGSPETRWVIAQKNPVEPEVERDRLDLTAGFPGDQTALLRPHPGVELHLLAGSRVSPTVRADRAALAASEDRLGKLGPKGITNHFGSPFLVLCITCTMPHEHQGDGDKPLENPRLILIHRTWCMFFQ